MIDRPKIGSLFAGVGGFDLGFEADGFEVAWQVENDRDAVSVLERHWPDVPRYGDIRTVNGADLAPVDVVVFGSPCQDFSVAGKRSGMAGERSGLFHEAVRVIAGLRPAPAFCLWENVPGSLSSVGGRDFGSALDALADIGALDIAWRVLDARHWGVPQRRRRIFLVCDFGAERAASVLFEPEGSGGDSAPSGAERQGAAGDAADGAGEPRSAGFYQEAQYGVKRYDDAGSLRAGRIPEHQMVVGEPDVAFAENYKGAKETSVAPTIGAKHGLDPLQNAGGLAVVTGGIDGSNGQVIARAVNCQQGIGDPTAQTFLVERSDVATASSAPSWMPCGGCEDFFCTVHEQHAYDCDCPSIEEWDVDPYTQTPAVAISENIRAEVRETPYANALAGGGGKIGQGYQGVRTGMAVRRLTPRECERLQGMPDDHTRWRADGREIPDGARYRMVGNAVAVPVIGWIARRMRAALEAAV